jgi:predicted RNase H-like HicB family nuclease
MENLNYTVIYEQAEEGNWGAYVPDLPVCCGGAATREELEVLMREAIEIHIEDLKAQGLPVPPPGSAAVVLEAAGYPVVLEQTESGTWSAHSVDLPVFATGKTLEDVRLNIAEGIGVWMEETRKDGMEIPAPSVVTVADAG